MFHHVAHAAPGRLLFTDWAAAAALWEDLARHVDGIVALVVLPDRVELLCRQARRSALLEAVRAYARWHAWNRGGRAPLWSPLSAPVRPADPHAAGVALHHLPCRAGLVADPLAWPFSTWRDGHGLARLPLLPPDPAAAPAPWLPPPAHPDLDRVAGAVSEWVRLPVATLRTHRLHRRLLLSAARGLTRWPQAEIARAYGVHRSAVSRAPALDPAELAVLHGLLADPRTPGLCAADPRLLVRPGRRPATNRGSRRPRTLPSQGIRWHAACCHSRLP